MMAQTPNFDVGGSIHVIVNNQVCIGLYKWKMRLQFAGKIKNDEYRICFTLFRNFDLLKFQNKNLFKIHSFVLWKIKVKCQRHIRGYNHNGIIKLLFGVKFVFFLLLLKHATHEVLEIHVVRWFNIYTWNKYCTKCQNVELSCNVFIKWKH